MADGTLTGSVLSADSEESYVITRSPSFFISTFTELFPFSFDVNDGFATWPFTIRTGNVPPLETGNYGFDPADPDLETRR